MQATIDRLLAQAHLFDDPDAYEAGIRDLLDALEATGVLTGPEAPGRPAATGRV